VLTIVVLAQPGDSVLHLFLQAPVHILLLLLFFFLFHLLFVFVLLVFSIFVIADKVPISVLGKSNFYQLKSINNLLPFVI
jgi:hypothetical protein